MLSQWALDVNHIQKHQVLEMDLEVKSKNVNSLMSTSATWDQSIILLATEVLQASRASGSHLESGQGILGSTEAMRGISITI